jgi:hypothetical protein
MEYSSPNARQMQNGSTAFMNPSHATPQDPDEINLLEYVYVLVKHKKLIAGLTLAGFVLGFIAALIKGPSWIAEAVIMPKETESQRSASMSSLGALGGLMASQLNLVGNASLDKMDLIIDSRAFGAKLIEEYSFLPVLFRYQWPKMFKRSWDPSQNKWKPTFVLPKPLDIGSFIRWKYVKKTKDTKLNTINLRIQSKDSTFTINLATMYVDYLNEYIKSNVTSEARENVAYLDSQLVSIADPLLREKILGLIANEIEKEMVVSKDAFIVVDPPYIYKNFKDKKYYPLLAAFCLFFLSCLTIIFMQVFASSEKSEGDQRLIEKIKRELPLVKAAGKT